MKVRIFKPHTHNRVVHRPDALGIELDVTAPEAAFLKQHGVLDPPKRGKAVAAPAPDLVEHTDA